MANICTWKDCEEISKHIQLDKNGKEWANLCESHNNELENDLNILEPKRMLRAWVLASGGAQVMAKKMF